MKLFKKSSINKCCNEKELLTDDKYNFLTVIASKNMNTGRIFSFVIIIFELFMLFYSIIIKHEFNLKSFLYICSYFTLLIVSVLTLFLIEKFKNSINIHYKLINKLTIFYCVFIIAWGILISTLDLNISNIHSIVYLTIIMSIACTVIMNPKIIIIISISSFVVYMLSIMFIPYGGFSFPLFINILFFTIMTAIISHNKYITCFIDYKHQKTILENNKKLKELNDIQADTNDKLKYASCTDALTGVNNRWGLHYLFDNIINKCYLNKLNLCVMMFDLDEFKNINDNYGHKAGDESLIRVAAIFKKNIDSKYIFRYGGEEFIVVLSNVTNDYAFKIADKIRTEIENEKIQAVKITISGGIYTKIPEKNSDSDEYLIGADKALYLAKTSGKNKIVINLE